MRYAILSLFMLSVLVIFEAQNYVKEEKIWKKL